MPSQYVQGYMVDSVASRNALRLPLYPAGGSVPRFDWAAVDSARLQLSLRTLIGDDGTGECTCPFSSPPLFHVTVVEHVTITMRHLVQMYDECGDIQKA